jgi:hypothetical protein
LTLLGYNKHKSRFMKITHPVEEAEAEPHDILLSLHSPAAVAAEAVAEHRHLPAVAHSLAAGTLLQAAVRQRIHRY